MALIKCPECGKEISDKAEKCPNCGCPVETMKVEEQKVESEITSEIDKTEADNPEPIEEKKQISKKMIGIICGVVGVIIIGAIVFYVVTANSRAYKSAKELFDAKQYEEAHVAFTEISEYEDSAEMANECLYLMAQEDFNEKKYDSAKGLFDQIESYKDSSDMAKECLYLKAQDLFENETYDKALECFNQLEAYKDSTDKVSECEYLLTVNGQFMKALSKGLMARWDYSNGGYEDEFGKNVNDLDSSEYMEYIRKCVNFELDLISSFESETFEDVTLEEKAKAYIELLNNCLKAIDYYMMDYNTYAAKWDDLYSERALMIRSFVNDYELTVDEEHQSTLNEFISNASIVDEQNALEQAVKDMMANFKLTSTSDGWGYTEYKISVKNTTEYTFEYFYIEMNALDENGNIIDTGWTTDLNSWKPGQEAELEAYFYNDTDSIETLDIEYIANYTVEN